MRIYRDNTYIYPDLYYIWTYIPESKYKSRITEKSLYRKWVCGLGFYSRYHARHIIRTCYSYAVASKIHIIKGIKLREQGITELPKTHRHYIYIGDNLRYVRRWVYPPDAFMDRHRRRHFVTKLVKAFNNGGWIGFNRKYKTIFNGYRISSTQYQLKRQRNKVIGAFVSEIFKAKSYIPDYLQ